MTNAPCLHSDPAQQILDHALCGFALHDVVTDDQGQVVDYVFLAVNPIFEQLTGLRADQIIGRRATEVIVGIENEPFIEIYGRVALSGEPARFRQRSAFLQRTYDISAFRTGLGQFAAMFADVSDQVAAEQSLRDSEKRFHNIVRDTDAGYFYLDNQGLFRDVNDAWLRMHGYTCRDQVIGQHYRLTQPPPDLPAADRNVASLLGGASIAADESARLCRDGSIGYHTFTAHPVRCNGEIIGLKGFLIDTTERRRARDKMRAALRAKELLLQEIHHRVKNNLQIVISLLELQADALDDPTIDAACHESCHRVHAMARIHEQLYQSGDLARVDMTAYVNSLWQYLRDSYGVYSISLELSADGIWVDMDTATSLGLILNELLSNALKYAFPARLDRLALLRVSLHADDAGLHVAVSDNGVGLPAGLDPDQADTLGLTLVRLLVGQLQGRQRVTSTAQGVTFDLLLPHRKSEPGEADT